MYKAICFNGVNGQPYKPVKLQNFLSVWDYVNIQKRLYPEVRIYDSKGKVCIQAVEGLVIRPATWGSVEREIRTQL